MRRTPPIGRTTHLSMYSPGGEIPQVLHGTWLESESFAYPAGGFTRKAYVYLRRNEHNLIELPYASTNFETHPYGKRYVVRCSIPDTYFTIPARLRYKGKTIKGFISIQDPDTETARFTFTPEAVPNART